MNHSPLTEDDLDHLESLLDSDLFEGEAMQLDEIQAMLCAVVSAPKPVPPSLWLPEAVGSAFMAKSETEAAEIMELLIRFNNDIARALVEGEMIAPIVYPLDEKGEEYDYASWADAYVFGCGLAGDWFELAGKHAEDLSELIEPMFILNGMLREDVEKSGERWFSPAEEERLVADIQENLPVIVQALYNFWRNKIAPAPAKGDENRVGRNDPCPCGSGKKFKQCCGNPDKLH